MGRINHTRVGGQTGADVERVEKAMEVRLGLIFKIMM